jgi:AcrR family transcriptional regulator
VPAPPSASASASASATEDARRPLRRDAERNRRLILAAAREAFATEGLHVTLDEIAHRAGVGVGTVYRRFADKESLIDALFEDGVLELAALADEALTYEDPWEGFVYWFERFVAIQAENRGLKEVVLSPRPGHDRLAVGRERLLPSISRLVKRAQASGELRADLRPTDIGLLAQALTSVADATREVTPDVYRRYVGIVLDGLRTRREAPGRLPVRAPTVDQLEAVRRAPAR